MEIIKSGSDPAVVTVHYRVMNAQGQYAQQNSVSPDNLTPAQQTVLEAIWAKGKAFVEVREGVTVSG